MSNVTLILIGALLVYLALTDQLENFYNVLKGIEEAKQGETPKPVPKPKRGR